MVPEAPVTDTLTLLDDAVNDAIQEEAPLSFAVYRLVGLPTRVVVEPSDRNDASNTNEP